MAKEPNKVEREDRTQGMLFGKQFYIWMIGGLVLIVIGLFLMAGGQMPSDEVWDENLIYSPRRTILAPIFIIAGLIVEVIAIFKK